MLSSLHQGMKILSYRKLVLRLPATPVTAFLFPTEGSILSLRKEFAGGPFGGEAEYGRLELQGAQFFKTSETMEQVLSFVARAGTLGRYNGKCFDVPFFERFFLAGLTTCEVGIIAMLDLKIMFQVKIERTVQEVTRLPILVPSTPSRSPNPYGSHSFTMAVT